MSAACLTRSCRWAMAIPLAMFLLAGASLIPGCGGGPSVGSGGDQTDDTGTDDDQSLGAKPSSYIQRHPHRQCFGEPIDA